MQEPVAPELPRAWEQLRAAMFDNLRSAECNEVGAWSMDVLAGAFGEKWPALAADRNADLLDATVYGAGSHLIAYAQIVELALRLRIFEDHVGIAAVRNQLRRDLRFEAWHHARLQLEVAALAVACGHSISLEPRLDRSRPPADVSLAVGQSDLIRVETFALFLDEQMRSDMDYDDAVGQSVMMIKVRHDVSVVGDLPARLRDEATREFLSNLDGAAARIAQTQTAEAFTSHGCQVHISPGFMTEDGESLNGPLHERNPWPRFDAPFLEKADQAARAGAGWLRVDVLDGLWQFTDFATWQLPKKAAFLRQYVHNLLGSSMLDGVVISSGAGMGSADTQSARGPDGTCGLRRSVQPARARETMILPLSALGQAQVGTWHQLYDCEPLWLPNAISHAGLPDVAEIGRPSA